ncbi:MAG: hypothetical protein PHX08_05640 [Lachnospiraceae bacterium]|nr:hypothetical protein [Lachnospiraceae bacterium]
MIKVAALVILYNYDDNCIDNIKSYANQVDIVYAFDNTENKNSKLEKKLKVIDNLEYIDGQGNRGLSFPINAVAKECIRKGYEWLITFDQDSIATENMISIMDDFASNFHKIKKVGIISPLIKQDKIKFSEPAYEFSYVDWVIQSGALHNLEAYEAIGGYDDNIFIDQLDTEYSFRLMDYGYKIIRLNRAILIHNVMDSKVKMKYLHGKKLYKSKYSPARYYYIIRNNLYCLKKYKNKNKLFCAYLRNSNTLMIKTWLLEDKKFARARAMVLGIFDFITGNMGKTKYNF